MNLETIYDNYLDMLQEEREEKYKEYKSWFSASSAGSCYKKQWYKVCDFEAEPFDIRTKRLLRLGTIVHEDVEKAIKHAEPAENVKIYTEHEIKLPEFNVIGHLDHCLIREDEDGIEMYISDLKTIASFSWTQKFGREAMKRGINSPPRIGHYELQVATYALGMMYEDEDKNTKYDDGKVSLNIVYYNKNDSAMKTVEIPIEAIDSAIAYWTDLNDFIEIDEGIENIPPDGAVGIPMQSWECKYCNYSKICKGA